MAEKRFSNIIGFDDAPFDKNVSGDVEIVGTVYAGPRLDGILIGKVEKDGFDSAGNIIQLIRRSRFLNHIQMIMLQGIAFGGFNVVDVFKIHEELGTPVLVVARRRPDLAAICRALNSHAIPDGPAKWKLIQRLGPMEPVGSAFVQRQGLSMAQAANVIDRFSIYGNVPEPLRTAHLIAGALSHGHSRGRP